MTRRHPKPRSKKSGNWANRQNRDQYVRQARARGLRARSVFKLEQIDQKYKLLRQNTKVVDLGAAPGSWSQYAAARVSGGRQIVAVDLLPMVDIAKVHFIQGDFTDFTLHKTIVEFFEDRKIDLVLSDMAPNITGIRITDQANAEQLQEAILVFCSKALNLNGNLLTKIFEGESAGAVRNKFSSHFAQVQMVKPDASRPESKEMYLLARGFKNSGFGFSGDSPA